MERLIREKKVVRLKKINIVKWGSGVARQHQIRSLPSLHLYEGKDLLSDDRQEVLEILQQ